MNKKEVVTTPEASTYGLCYSPAVKYGDVIYVSGQVGADEKGNIPATIQEQTVLAIENAKKLIDAAGSSLENVIMCQCFLQKNEDFYLGVPNIDTIVFKIVVDILAESIIWHRRELLFSHLRLTVDIL